MMKSVFLLAALICYVVATPTYGTNSWLGRNYPVRGEKAPVIDSYVDQSQSTQYTQLVQWENMLMTLIEKLEREEIVDRLDNQLRIAQNLLGEVRYLKEKSQSYHLMGSDPVYTKEEFDNLRQRIFDFAEKIHSMPNKETTHLSVDDEKYLQQFNFWIQRLRYIQKAMEDIKEEQQQKGETEKDWQNHYIMIEGYLHLLEKNMEKYQEIRKNGEEIPTNVELQYTKLFEDIEKFEKVLTSTYHYDFVMPKTNVVKQQPEMRKQWSVKGPVFEKTFSYEKDPKQGSGIGQFDFTLKTPFAAYQKTIMWNLKRTSPLVEKRSYNEQSLSSMFGRSKRLRQKQAGYLPNQWDFDQTEMDTFQDLIRQYFKPARNQYLQSQISNIDESKIEVTQSAVIVKSPEYIERQKQVLKFYKNIHQATIDPEIVQWGRTYSIEQNVENYEDVNAVHQLLKQYELGFLPKEAAFSIFNPEHIRQVLTIFKVLYTSKDWETFVKTSSWVKMNVNEDLFNYVFTVALVQRGDTDYLLLPPSYLVNPHYFINKYVLQKAQSYKQYLGGQVEDQKYVIYSNYSGWYMNLHPEQYMSYFLEDVGLNDYYFNYHLNYPFWLNSEYLKQGGDRRGEQSYYVVQQLLARYTMERLSNDMELTIPEYNLEDGSVETGYVPSLRYPNGIEFPTRPSDVPLGKDELIDDIELFAMRIKDAIDAGYVIDENGNKVELIGEDGFEILMNAVENNPESPNPHFYGPMTMIMRWVLGYSPEPLNNEKLVPSALEQYETTLRDPVAWQMFKKIVELVQYYKRSLPSYNEQQLKFPGVQIKDLEVDELVTYFDEYDVDISQAVYVNEEENAKDSVKIVARQSRLNHQPFSVKIKVESEDAQPAVVRTFLGPKYDEYGREITIEENRLNFFEIDKFKTNLVQGVNKIVRESREMNVIGDWILDKIIENENENEKSLRIEFDNILMGFPDRLLLPKGQRGGQTFQIYVMVTPLVESPQYKSAIENMKKLIIGKHEDVQNGILNQYVDALPLGYPFDREIDESVFFKIDNSVFQDVVIRHEGPEIHDSRIKFPGHPIYQERFEY